MQALIDLCNNIIGLDPFRILFVVTDSKAFFELVKNYNLEEQLFKKGIDSNGEVIGTYSVITESFNEQKKAGTPYTLKDTGEFFRSFDLLVTETDIFIEGERDFDGDNPFEEGDIFDKYGIDILGLTDENHNKVIEYVTSKMPEIILQEAFKGV